MFSSLGSKAQAAVSPGCVVSLEWEGHWSLLLGGPWVLVYSKLFLVLALNVKCKGVAVAAEGVSKYTKDPLPSMTCTFLSHPVILADWNVHTRDKASPSLSLSLSLSFSLSLSHTHTHTHTNTHTHTILKVVTIFFCYHSITLLVFSVKKKNPLLTLENETEQQLFLLQNTSHQCRRPPIHRLFFDDIELGKWISKF